jgi:spectinomycin phosphotransferase
MIEPLGVPDTTLAGWVATGWAHEVAIVRFIPAGLDGWGYQVDGYFLKVRRSAPAPPAWRVPWYLRQCGLTPVVAPVPTSSGAPYLAVSGFSLLLYPYVDGSNLWERGLTDPQWTEYGRFLRALHSFPLPDVDLPVEAFVTTAPDRLEALAPAAAVSPWVAELWTAHGDTVRRLAGEVRSLAGRAAALDRPQVLCHADIHPGNLLADAGGGLHVVDWDAPIVAPRERDLLFVFSGEYGEDPINPHREALFRRGYGEFPVDDTLMTYYRQERRLDDIALFLANILDPEITEVTRANELYWLRRILA